MIELLAFPGHAGRMWPLLLMVGSERSLRSLSPPPGGSSLALPSPPRWRSVARIGNEVEQ